jgi:D-amino-acid dehydrogenase
MNDDQFDLAIVGAGAVGMSCAMWAHMRGMHVLLVDENLPGSGASFGNAGTIATYACVPVNSPDILRSLPKLLFSRQSPLGMDWLYGLANLPWVLQFLRNCSPGRVRKITDQLGDLLSYSDSGLDPLIAEADADDLMVANDCLYVYSSAAGYDAAATGIEARRRNGVTFDVLDGAAIRALEPALKLPIHKGLMFRGARHVRDPQALIERFHASYLANGGTWLQSRVSATAVNDGGVTLDLADGTQRCARHVVIAAGAHSKSIAGSGASDLPLDTERGHHVMYKDHADLVSRPVGWADAGLYATPMSGGLRIAGTVEIAGLQKPKSKRRIAYLTRKSHEMFGDIGTPDEDWLGFRPTMPDALPVIGRSPRSDNILFAFGHQHVGLTLGGITGRIIADLVQDQPPNFDITAFDPKRFTAP